MMTKKPRFIVDAPERFKELEEQLCANARFEPHTKYVASSNSDDVDIFNAAVSNDRHILTQNKKDFVPLQKSHPHSKIGVIGFNPQTTNQNLIGMLKKELKINKAHGDYYGASISLEAKYRK